MKTVICTLITLLLLINLSMSAVYEARNSDDVDFFLDHNPEENGALLFYNSKEENLPQVKNNLESVLSIYKNYGEQGRSEEEWVKKLNDKVHIMRIDVSSIDNARSVKEYRVGQTPLVVLLANTTTLFEEVVDRETFAHIKEIYVEEQKKAEAKAAAAGKTEAPSSVFPDAEYVHNKNGQATQNGTDADVAKKAQKAAEDAKKAAEDALKALQEATKAFEQHSKIEQARQEAEQAKKVAEKAQKDLEEAKKMIADHLADDKKTEGSKTSTAGDDEKCDSGTGATKPSSGGQSKAFSTGQSQAPPTGQGLVAPPGYTIEYIPVIKNALTGQPVQQPNSQQQPSITYRQPTSSSYTTVPSTSTKSGKFSII